MQRLVISANIRTCINAVLKAEGVMAKCEINVLVTDDAGIPGNQPHLPKH